ncbi:ABC transporter substrate-binding protein [Xanthobacter sp. 126]|uniref:ABC transporter substrate-binding protein n=1 Tax=Xanthobacter sp. 126 TaxID=1131814 RepID=UPI00045E7DEE|nr:ABC transporter substrate-binding protein [Xanthobacter sp. 126]
MSIREALAGKGVVLALTGFCAFSFALAWHPPRAAPLATVEAGPAQRLIAYAPVVEAVTTLDDGPARIVAAPSYLRDQAKGHPLIRVFPQMATLGTTGAVPVPDPEEVMRRDADAVVVAEGLKGNLVEIGYPRIVAIPGWRGDMRAEARATWLQLADVLGRDARANALLAAEEADAQSVRRREGAALEVMVLIPIAGEWRVGGRRLYLNALLRQLGARNVAEDLPLNSSADIEQVLMRDPQVILLLAGPGMPAPPDLYRDPRWQGVRAVRRRRVYLMPANTTFNAPVDASLFAAWLEEVLFPVPGPARTPALYAATYARAFGRTLGAEDVRFALKWQENAGSAFYDRFNTAEVEKPAP